MDITNIEKETFEEMLSRLNSLAEEVELFCCKYSRKKPEEWLDGQDVCLMLNISPRTLQAYRDSGKISFSQINYKIYYKLEDVNELINKNFINIKNNTDGIKNKEK